MGKQEGVKLLLLFHFDRSVDKDGEPVSVRWSSAGFSSFFNNSADDFERWLAAMKEFHKIFYELSIKLKSAAGK